MKKALLISLFIIMSPSINAQIGIGTTNPQATLEITANDPDLPQTNEGIIIPKLNTLPSDNPDVGQDGMLIFLSNDLEVPDESGITTYYRGFYYWSQPLQDWVRVTTNEGKTFRVIQTFASPTSIEDNVFREGVVSVGREETSAQVSAIVNNSTQNLTSKPRKSLFVLNNHPSTGASYHTFGIDVDNASTVNGMTYGVRIKNSTSTQNSKYGIHNQVTAPGSGIHYGIYNSTSQNGTSTADMYGIRNEVGRTYGVSSLNFGIYNIIGSNTSAGTIYGIYSEAVGNDAATVYAAYFVGNVSIGTDASNNYILPPSRGNQGEVLAAGINGSTHWQPNATRAFTTISSAISSFEVTSAMSTVRIDAEVNDVNLPDASLLPGKIYTLITATGVSPSNINAAGASIIIDDVAGGEITQITANERIIIQSDGTDWIVIGN